VLGDPVGKPDNPTGQSLTDRLNFTGLTHRLNSPAHFGMPHPPILPPTETMTLQPTWGRRRWQWPVWGLGQWGHGLALGWAIAIGAAVVAQPNWVQALERQAQSLVLQLRPEVVPPANIVILAIDETSVSQLPQWPLPRQTYAQVIDRLMAAGAQAVSIDVLWDLPSSYGSATAAPDCDPKTASADDQALATVLARYSGRVTLAAHLERSDGRTGSQSTLQLPYCPLLAAQPRLGSINFLLEPSLNHLWTTNLQSNQQLDKQYQGPVHQLGSEFLQRQAQQSVESQEQLQETQMVSFAEATLMAARGDARSGRAAQNTNPDIFFYGRSGRFPTISFADVVQNWNSDYLQKGRLFQGKIVLIGPTAPTIPDFLNTPMGSMAGVELHANAIATLMEGRALGPLLPNPWAAGGLVTLVGLGLAGLQMRLQRARDRGLAAGLGGSAWLGLGYGGLTLGGLWLPMALPVLMMGLMGASHLTIGLLSERRHKRRLRSTMKQYARSPLVQEIISQQDDRELSTLLQERDRELQGKVLGSRYKIIRILGSGGFGETYIAEDFQRPGQPQCVVKQLRPASDNPKHWQQAV
jgi:CHASE2 domain-containing sensor protein